MAYKNFSREDIMSREEMIACIKCILEDAADWEVETAYNMILENIG